VVGISRVLAVAREQGGRLGIVVTLNNSLKSASFSVR